ncbi:MAG: glycosyltransferase family 4 protein [Alphaproteobacteria bacterium]|nr:glycosyltransferase family 4 protein [Alphaproteobacteria bacterium]
MKILFVHPNMPGQYRNLCRYAAQDKNNTVVFLTRPTKVEAPGVHKLEYVPSRTASPTTHRYIIGLEKAVLQGQETWRACKKLQAEEGFKPDVIVGHPGWGDCLYLKDLWPDVPLLSYFEFYYKSHGADVGFEDPVAEDDEARVRTKNSINLLNLEACDWGISPTHWQKSVHPAAFQNKITVLHDGIDTEFCRPDPQASVTLPNGKTFKAGDEVVTYIARNFEPYRGLETFMRAAEIILKNRPNCHIIAVGADGVSYGKQLPKGTTYLGQWKEKVKLDESRIHFTGMVSYPDLIKIIQVGAAHIYLTYPFVLSWSTLEAMATGCLLIGSDTTPLHEVIEDGKNGLLVDFFSPEQLAKRVDEALDNREKMQPIRDAARRTIEERYALKKLLPLHMELITDVARGEPSPLTNEKIQSLYAA